MPKQKPQAQQGWLTSDVQKSIKKRSKLWQKYKRTQQDRDFAEYKNQRNIALREVRTAKAEYKKGLIKDLEGDMPVCSQYPTKLGRLLNDQRKENQFCDVVIKMGGKSFPAHKSILAAASEHYFNTMFNSSFKESTENEISIDGSPEIFEVLLSFIYTGKLKMTSEAACEILEMACYMQITDLLPVFCKYVRTWLMLGLEKFSVEDIFKIGILARSALPTISNRNLLDLIEDCDQFLEKHLTQLVVEPTFLEHGHVNFLEEFLSRNKSEYDVKMESKLLDLVVAWLKHDWSSRKAEAHNLLSTINLELISDDLTKKIDEDILALPECRKLVEKVVGSKVLNKTSSKQSRKVKAPILASSYQDTKGRLCCSFRYFDEKSVQWKLLKNMASLPSQSAKYQSFIVVDGRLYALGGYDEEVVLSSHEDSDSEDWNHNRYADVNPQNLEPRETQRLAGFQRELDNMSCQFNHWQNFRSFSHSKNKWKGLSAMNTGRYNCHLVALDGFIYAIGGSSRHGDAKSDVECYDIKNDAWGVLPSLPEGYRWVSSVAMHGRILALGRSCSGRSEDMHNAEVTRHVLYVYNTETNAWSIAEESPASFSVTVTRRNRRYVRKPVLFIHNGVCYRVLYQVPTDLLDLENRCDWMAHSKPSVKALEWSFDDSDLIAINCVEEIKQDLIGANEVGAFRIDNEVFVNEKGFVYNTGIKIAPGQVEEVSLAGWKNFDPQLGLHSNAVWFDFDRKKLAF